MIETQLIQLPNGDLHRGFRPELKDADPNVEIVPTELANPLNRAVAEILTASKGGKTLTCNWCGLQFDRQFRESEVRKHLQDNHKSAVEVLPENAVLMAALAEKEAALAAATAKSE